MKEGVPLNREVGDALYFSLCIGDFGETRVICTRPAKGKHLGAVNMSIQEFWEMLELRLKMNATGSLSLINGAATDIVDFLHRHGFHGDIPYGDLLRKNFEEMLRVRFLPKQTRPEEPASEPPKAAVSAEG
jgi:hypothetical protein